MAKRREVEFEKIAEKPESLTDGYLAKDKNGKLYILKCSNGDVVVSRLIAVEYVASALIKKILMDATPDIELFISKKRRAAIASSYLDEFQTLYDFTDSDQRTRGLGKNKSQLLKTTGFEKVLVASVLIGDKDFHSENIGIIPNGDNMYKVVKLDHGVSLSKLKFDSYESFIFCLWKFGRYEKEDLELFINPDKLIEAIDEICHFTRKQIVDLIGKQIDELEELKVDLKNIRKIYGEIFSAEVKDRHNHDVKTMLIEGFADNVMQNMANLKLVSAELKAKKLQCDAQQRVEVMPYYSSCANMATQEFLTTKVKIEGSFGVNENILNAIRENDEEPTSAQVR